MSRPGPSPCTTSTARGGRPTSSSAMAASCARGTRTPRCRSCGMPPRAASTSTCGRQSSGRPRSSTRWPPAGRSTGTWTTSGTKPCPMPRSRRWPPATRSSWRRRQSTPTSPGSAGCAGRTSTTSTGCAEPWTPPSGAARRPDSGSDGWRRRSPPARTHEAIGSR